MVHKEFKYNAVSYYISNYEDMDIILKKLVYNTVKEPFLEILNLNDMNINLTYDTEDNHETYFLLQDYIQRMLNNFNTRFFSGISGEMCNYLSLYITNYSFIPKDFFTTFELVRIRTTETGEFVELVVQPVSCEVAEEDTDFGGHSEVAASDGVGSVELKHYSAHKVSDNNTRGGESGMEFDIESDASSAKELIAAPYSPDSAIRVGEVHRVYREVDIFSIFWNRLFNLVVDGIIFFIARHKGEAAEGHNGQKGQCEYFFHFNRFFC